MTIIDFFAGAGGSSLGAEAAGCHVVCAVNHWSRAVETLRHNRPGLEVREETLTRVHHLPDADGLLFSPECTHHSNAQGARKADPVAERSRTTAWQVIRWIRKIRPRWFVVENVAEFQKWRMFPLWRRHLLSLGYQTSENILDSSRFGVPQRRLRWFTAGHRERPVRLPDGNGAPARTVRECIDWSLPAEPLEGRRRPLVARRMQAIASLRAASHQDGLIVYYGSGPQWMHLDRPCRTVSTVDRFGLVTADDCYRMLQPSELRAIMGFPADYYLAGTRRDRIKLLGNAVCPPVMQAIVEEVLS